MKQNKEIKNRVNEGWENMLPILDREMPVKKDRRYLLLWFLLPILLGMGYTMFINYNNETKEIIQPTERINMADLIDQKKPLEKTRKPQVNTNKTEAVAKLDNALAKVETSDNENFPKSITSSNSEQFNIKDISHNVLNKIQSISSGSGDYSDRDGNQRVLSNTSLPLLYNVISNNDNNTSQLITNHHSPPMDQKSLLSTIETLPQLHINQLRMEDREPYQHKEIDLKNPTANKISNSKLYTIVGVKIGILPQLKTQSAEFSMGIVNEWARWSIGGDILMGKIRYNSQAIRDITSLAKNNSFPVGLSAEFVPGDVLYYGITNNKKLDLKYYLGFQAALSYNFSSTFSIHNSVGIEIHKINFDEESEDIVIETDFPSQISYADFTRNNKLFYDEISLGYKLNSWSISMGYRYSFDPIFTVYDEDIMAHSLHLGVTLKI